MSNNGNNSNIEALQPSEDLLIDLLLNGIEKIVKKNSIHVTGVTKDLEYLINISNELRSYIVDQVQDSKKRLKGLDTDSESQIIVDKLEKLAKTMNFILPYVDETFKIMGDNHASFLRRSMNVQSIFQVLKEKYEEVKELGTSNDG